MKKLITNALIVCSLYILSACEDIIKVTLPANEQKLVVDAQLHNGGGPQSIKLMLTQPYFDNSPPPPALGAEVTVTDNNGKIFTFVQKPDSTGKPSIIYEFTPKANEVFGKTGNEYTLNIKYNGNTYTASSKVHRVPVIDSLIYVYKDQSANLAANPDEPKKGYRPEFYARDPTGEGDCYYIKGYRYDKATKKWELEREEAAYDAAFQPGSRADGLVFILPLRRAIASQLFNEGDSTRVDLYSISQSHFYFLRAAENEENNQGLFATPPATFNTNIISSNPSKKALGWFSVAGKASLQAAIEPKKASPDND
jgi:hypothetical protein